MERSRLLPKHLPLSDSSYVNRSTIVSHQKNASTLSQIGKYKMYIHSCVLSKNVRDVLDKRCTEKLLCSNSKARCIRLFARSDQKSKLPLECEDTVHEESSQSFLEASPSTAMNPEGQGTLQGAIALIIGTSVGAGLLALPARTVNAGFVPTLATMGTSWVFLVFEALLLAEVNVALLEGDKNKTSGSMVSLCAMAEKTLGPLGGIISACIYIFLTYTELVAYIAKSGDILSPLIHVPPLFSCWIFTLVFGSFTLLGNTKLVDSLNQMLTSAMIGTFILIVVGGFGITDWKGLQHMDWGRTTETFPAIFFALVYHDLMPVLCNYLKGDIHRIRLAVLFGSSIPLAMFLCWDAIILCIAPVSGSEDPLEFLTRSGGTSIVTVIELFSILALATSLIGTLIGFMAFLEETLARNLTANETQLKASATHVKLIGKYITENLLMVYPRYRSGHHSSYSNRNEDLILSRVFGVLENGWRSRWLQIASFVLILAPPLVALSMVSDAFFSATDLAGGYGMTTLYGVFPPIMAWSLHERGLFMKKDPGGYVPVFSTSQIQAFLVVSGTFALGIIVSQLMLDFGVLF